ncbi:MAG: hypothetical protein MUC48_14570 [Leptolyngbya sp. Prado105]|jgi:hypothetical protein|nr:hypothetical protein [Leptolyngbya sp. Prado105]
MASPVSVSTWDDCLQMPPTESNFTLYCNVAVQNSDCPEITLVKDLKHQLLTIEHKIFVSRVWDLVFNLKKEASLSCAKSGDYDSVSPGESGK